MMTATSVHGVGGVDGEQERRVVLHRTLKRIAKVRAFLDTREAQLLREAQQLRLWKEFGYTSLVDYMGAELGYTPRAAEERLRVANALPELPMIEKALQTGELNFSQAKELVRVATPETEHAWIGNAQDKNVREVERAVSGHAKGDLPTDPIDPKLVRKTMWLSVRPETEVIFREVRRKLEKQRGERLDDDGVMEALCRAFLAGGETSAVANNTEPHVGANAQPHVGANAQPHVGANAAQPHVGANATQPHVGGGAAPYRVAVTVCAECKRGWQHGGGAVEEMSPAAVERAQCDAQNIGDVSSGSVERATQTIPPAVRRKVLHRDQERCQVPGCSSHKNLDIHHIVHRGHGGTHELSNLVTLCEAHHLAHHDGALAIERRTDGTLELRREGRNRFTRATREVETKAALRSRGVERGEMQVIMRKTINHIGEADLSAEQWLAIALRYANQRKVSG